MSEFEFGIDIEAELATIHDSQKAKTQERSRRPPIKRDVNRNEKQGTPINKPVKQGGGTGGAGKPAASQSGQGNAPVTPAGAQASQAVPIKSVEPEGRTAKHTQEEFGGSGSSSDTSTKTTHAATINWKEFKTLPGIFEHVGGDRPVGLAKEIPIAGVGRLPKPLIEHVRRELKLKHSGKTIDFPWGVFQITDDNKVFTSNATVSRYLLFDALRDDSGTHVQYALQHMILNQMPMTAFDPAFDVKRHLLPHDDTLDMYAVLYVAFTDGLSGLESHNNGQIESAKMLDAFDNIEKLHVNLGHVMQRLNQQDEEFNAYSERNHAIQTVLLLDRMGLLEGNIPKDVGEFKGVLEQSRDVLHDTGKMIDSHIIAEKERFDRIKREELFRRVKR